VSHASMHQNMITTGYNYAAYTIRCIRRRMSVVASAWIH
jgi:hypothetical protein